MNDSRDESFETGDAQIDKQHRQLSVEEEGPFDDIVEVRLKHLGVYAERSFVQTRSGRTYDFVTSGRRQLLEINTAHMRTERRDDTG